MSFLSAVNMCKINMNFSNYWNINNAYITNFKKYRMKVISSHLVYVKKCFGNKSDYICITNVFEKRLLNITQHCVENKRKTHHRSHKKFVFKPVNDSYKKVLSHQSLTDCLQKCESVAEQIELFHSFMKLPEKDISSRRLICQELENILKPYYTSCSVYLVGSSINGFGVKGCDVDLSLQCSSPIPNQCSLDEVVSSLEEDTSEGKLPLHHRVFEFSPKFQLLSIKKILQDLNIGEPLTFIPGRCSILNFYHQNLSCDLSVNNSSALQGSNLMLLCSKLDERVTKLVQIIIYWAKHSKLIGGPVKFKSYSMFLLITYFLQTRNPPVLPSVKIMFEKTDFLENLENWSYDVGKYISSFEKSKNTQSVEDLLREFFFFYGNFDFSYVICPLNGCAVDRKTFATKIDCETSFELHTICIQDPLNPAWNVTTGVSWKFCKNLLKALISVCENYHNSNCWSPGPNNWGLTFLINNAFSYNDLRGIKEFVINVPIDSRTSESTEDNIKVLEAAADSVEQILKYCLLFPCYRVDSYTNFSSLYLPQNVKIALQNEFLNSTNDNFIKETNSNYCVSYVCVTKDTWTGRSSFTSLTNNAENLLENEHMTSKKMDLKRGSNEKEAFYFFCQCCTRNSENGVNLHIKFKHLNNTRFIPKLAVFLKEFIPKFMDPLLLNSLKEKEKLILE